MEEDLESSEIEEPESSDEEMGDESEAPVTTGAKEVEKNIDNGDDDKSETISTVSADTPDSPPSPTQQEINWQSSILGNTKIAKKARKKERHARRLALSEGRSEARKLKKVKLARRLDRKERRQKRAGQIERRDERDDARFGTAAKQAGLPISRYKRKLERGEIKFGPDGKPEAISKKELKKARKAAEKAAANGDAGSSKKRKREEEVIEKKKKKKQRTED